MDEDGTRSLVREKYGEIAARQTSCCTPVTSCCGGSDADAVGKVIGYTAEELANLPEGANLGLGCGNPTALASLGEGETFLDLGSGAGIDCFLAARKVGPAGRAIGVDMTPQMLSRARENAKKGGFDNVEFRLGEIEHLPVADSAVDVISSNCVINLSPDKGAVFAEAFRVLRPGGRLMISDVVLLRDLPEKVLASVEAYVGCIAGALRKEEYLGLVEGAGFGDVSVVSQTDFPSDDMLRDGTLKELFAGAGLTEEDLDGLRGAAASITFSAVKPGTAQGSCCGPGRA